MPQRLPRTGAGVARGFEQGAINAHHRIEDRHDHEHGVEVHVGQQHREVGIQQPVLRLVDEVHGLQRLVDEAVAAQQRDPGDHADHVGGPEWHRADHEQQCLHRSRSHVKRQEIRQRKTQHQRERPGAERKAQRRQIRRRRHAQVTVFIEMAAAFPQLGVVAQGEGWQQRVLVKIPEADHRDQPQRDEKEHDEHRRKRQRLQARTQGTGSGRSGRCGGRHDDGGAIRQRQTRSTCGPCTRSRP